ncbi:type I restriction enzyme S subunit [Deinococcus sp. HSC-46F16]|uniref:restriction endonuclease subunit S n=1 Tax=Deinococcus sp. HSC-46F16 TaxID=2910968 RepID=UPI00209DAFB1|nr:restriction endonuclease subunit S [Deinococcus sp. HSC-46F16]MCP2015928.1 type I restriction enzyme S subunit [Deinococcus sp. HSC-46F16]
MTWERVRLGDIATVVSGATPKTGVDEYWDGDIAWATPKDLSGLGRKYISETESYITEKGYKSCSTILLPPNSVLLSSRAPIGHVAINAIPMATNQGFKSLIPKQGALDASYLYHWLKSQTSYLNSLGRGATFKEVSKTIVEDIEIPLPPLPVQQRIAAVLDEVDALRQKRERSIEGLEALRESAYIHHLAESQASSVRVRVSDLIDPHRGGMRTGPFGSQLLHSEFVDDPSGIMVLGIDNAVKNRFRYTGERYITPEKYEGLRRYTVHPGDVLVTIMGTCGRVAIVPSNIPTAINTKHLCAMSLNEQCLPEYLHATLIYNPSVLKQMGASARGAIMDGLNMGIISALEFDLPEVSEQRKLQTVFAEIDSLTDAALHARQTEGVLLSSLQTRAFSGKLNLRELTLS